jgi:hypothetical protein
MLLPDRQINGGVGTREACGTEDRRSATSKFAKERQRERGSDISERVGEDVEEERENAREIYKREKRWEKKKD